MQQSDSLGEHSWTKDIWEVASDKAALIKLLCALGVYFRMQQEEPPKQLSHLIWPRHSQG